MEGQSVALLSPTYCKLQAQPLLAPISVGHNQCKIFSFLARNPIHFQNRLLTKPVLQQLFQRSFAVLEFKSVFLSLMELNIFLASFVLVSRFRTGAVDKETEHHSARFNNKTELAVPTMTKSISYIRM